MWNGGCAADQYRSAATTSGRETTAMSMITVSPRLTCVDAARRVSTVNARRGDPLALVLRLLLRFCGHKRSAETYRFAYLGRTPHVSDSRRPRCRTLATLAGPVRLRRRIRATQRHAAVS